jgi:hypothetical protein
MGRRPPFPMRRQLVIIPGEGEREKVVEVNRLPTTLHYVIEKCGYSH